MYDILLAAYGRQAWWPAQTSFEVVLGAYLTQNTAWRGVERSLENLRAAKALTIEGLRMVSVAELQRLIRPSGFPVRKSTALKAFVEMLDLEFSGSLETLARLPTPALRSRLLKLPGVGPETADAILLYALGHSLPMADEYLRRIAERHRLLNPPPLRTTGGYNALIQLTTHAFEADLPADRAQLFNEFHALTVAVGKAHCGRIARCAGCPLAADLTLNGVELPHPAIRK